MKNFLRSPNPSSTSGWAPGSALVGAGRAGGGRGAAVDLVGQGHVGECRGGGGRRARGEQDGGDEESAEQQLSHVRVLPLKRASVGGSPTSLAESAPDGTDGSANLPPATPYHPPSPRPRIRGEPARARADGRRRVAAGS